MRLIKGSVAKGILRYGPMTGTLGAVFVQFGTDFLVFWDDSVPGGNVDLTIAFYDPEKPAQSDTKTNKFLPVGTDLHRAFQSVMTGYHPEPFFDLLMDHMPWLEDAGLIDKYVNGVTV